MSEVLASEATGVQSPSTRSAGMVAFAAAALVTLGIVLLIALRPAIEPIWDQSFIGYTLGTGFPHFEAGIVSYLLVGVVNAIAPLEPAAANTLIRGFAAVLYMGSTALLAWSITGPARLWGFLAFVLLVSTARFPFLWLSSELFAATFLMLLLWSLVRGHRFVVTAAFLVLFSLSKADLALPGLLVAAYLVVRDHPLPRWRRAALLGAMAAALLVPSVLFASSHYAQYGGRTWVAFGQHYGELVRWLQIDEAPPGWTASLMYLERGFPGTSNVAEAALSYPRRYAYFVGLSATESAIRLVPTKLLLLIPVAAWFFRGVRPPARATVLLVLTSVVPIVMLSFLHVRYQARFYPLALFVIFAGLRDGPFSSRHERWLAAGLAVMLLWQLVDLAPVLATAHWLPD